MGDRQRIHDLCRYYWNHNTTYTYWARHYSSPQWANGAKYRVTSWSDSVQITTRDTLTVYITGNDTIPPDKECAWTAVAGNGNPPFAYSWSGDLPGKTRTTQVVTESFSASEELYELIVSVTDSLGWQATDTFYVFADIELEGEECEVR